jgi:mannitol/fructose-specific phosphotransferase system IIA component (Ntr-type)
MGDVAIVLDIDSKTISGCCQKAVDSLLENQLIPADARARVEEAYLAACANGPAVHEHHNAVLMAQYKPDEPGPEVAILVRLRSPIPSDAAHGGETWFVWILLSNEKTAPEMQTAAGFMKQAADAKVLEALKAAKTPEALSRTYSEAIENEVSFSAHVSDELKPSGRLFGGFINDIKRRLPHYLSDYIDGLTPKSLASILFLYFACLAPAVAFGGLLSVKTDGEIGVIEMIVATTLCGVVYALTAAQPLTILGSTGPVIIFMGLLYTLCGSMGVAFLPAAGWVAMWTMVFLLIFAFTDASCWIRYFTRFTDDTFAALIALIFVYEAVKDVVKVFQSDASVATALLSLILALGTFMIAMRLKKIRTSPYLRGPLREFFSDFGPAIAIILMTGLAFLFVDNPEVALKTLAVPDEVSTSSGRPWLVDLTVSPLWVKLGAAIPALLVSILLYLDQNITVRLVNNPEYKLKKGAGYHLDLALVGVLVGICGLFGLPWMVAATVRSLNHVNSLTKRKTVGDTEVITGVVETRVSALGVHVLVGVSLLFLPVLKNVPMSVLFGLFLFMGIAAMNGNQFFERLRLWVMDPERYPATSYLRVIPTRTVHTFTAIQGACLAVLWVVKSSTLGILFPLFIALLVPVRMLMGRFFNHEHLALLDAEEHPEEEMGQEGT